MQPVVFCGSDFDRVRTEFMARRFPLRSRYSDSA